MVYLIFESGSRAAARAQVRLHTAQRFRPGRAAGLQKGGAPRPQIPALRGAAWMSQEPNQQAWNRDADAASLVSDDSQLGTGSTAASSGRNFDLRIEKNDTPLSEEPVRRSYVPENEAGGSRTAKRAAKPKSKAREALSWILSIGLAVAAAFLIRAFLFEIILVDGDSMLPTLETSERIGIEKVTRYTSLPERGDIIIVRYPNMDGTYVKRTIALPGETVQVLNSTVYINGVPLDEPYVSAEPYADMDPVVVPEGHVFVMGDNRAHSMDSRASYIGPIAESEIIGHGLFVLWPLSNIHMINN